MVDQQCEDCTGYAWCAECGMPTECMMRAGKSISRAEALRLSQETLERAERERVARPEQDALDAARDAVVEAACELRAARKRHDTLHAQPALSEKESRYAATLLMRIAHWSAALDAAVDEYKRSQGG